MDIRNEIKSYIVREGVTMTEVVEKLAYEKGVPTKSKDFAGRGGATERVSFRI